MTVKTYARARDAIAKATKFVEANGLAAFVVSIEAVSEYEKFAASIKLRVAAGEEIRGALLAQGYYVAWDFLDDKKEEENEKKEFTSEKDQDINEEESNSTNQTQGTLKMNEQVENTVEEAAEANVDLAAAVTAAEGAYANAVAAAEAAKEAAKDAAKNHRAAVAYAKSVTGDVQEEANNTAAAWEAEMNRTKDVAEAAKEAVKAAKTELTAAKKAAVAGKVSVPKADRISQNGQTRPTPDSRSGKLWAIFDEASAERGAPCAVGDVMDKCSAFGMTEGSIRSSYSHWRKFNGVAKGRIESINAPAMSAEKHAEEVAKITALLDKANARAATLQAKLDALTATPVEEAA